MISLIICSRSSDIDVALKENIKNTIGTDYELVIIDNSNNDYSIFSAYNEGVRRAKGDILCFMHEDILYRTEDWGKKIIAHFEDKSIGLIGFAGTHFLPSTPTYWFTSPFISENNLTNDNGDILECKKLDFFFGNTIVDIVTVDGFCFFVRRSLFKEIAFDEDTFNGFHFYDMDICMQVLKCGSRVCACNDILIEHEWSEQSLKKIRKEFTYNNMLFFDKWKELLPISRGIDHIPPYVTERINRLYLSAYDAEKARNSKAYRLGRLLLSPFKKLKH